MEKEAGNKKMNLSVSSKSVLSKRATYSSSQGSIKGVRRSTTVCASTLKNHTISSVAKKMNSSLAKSTENDMKIVIDD